MSENSQPSVPPSAQPDPESPVAPRLSAEPQYPAGTHELGATLSPAAPQAHPTATPAPLASPTAASPTGASPTAASPTATPQAYPTATPQAYPTAAPQGYAPFAPGFPNQLAAPTRPHARNPLGRTAFAIAVATLAINLFGSLARPFFYGGGPGYDFMFLFDNGIGILSFFAYALAFVLGVMAARRAAPQLLAGIAIGVGGAGAVGLAFTGLALALYRYF